VYTSIGNKQLYAGNVNYINSEDALGTDEWDEGFGHHNSCTGCHAQHGVSNNFGDATLYGQYGTFQGPVRTKILKVRAKGSGGAVGSPAEYVWQDEVIYAGSTGKTEAQAAFGAFWANSLAVDDARVDPLNVPLFPSATDAIMGTRTRPDADVADAQVSAFCTFCHQNYGYASEATVNPNGSRSLFQGPWYALAGTVPNVSGAPGSWVTMNGAGAYGAPFKNHPVKSTSAALGTTFAAAGKSASVPADVAFAGAATCRSCHDAGLENSSGVIVQSWPHFTPGYFHFTKSAAHVGAPMTYAPPIPDQINANNLALITSTWAWLDDPVNYEEALTVADGQCLKCHVNATDDAGVGKTY
jgi:cytochrome c553